MSRTYGQFCGLAHALELVGERWALLVVRDLIAGPRRFTDLRRGLPRIPTNILAARLKELEAGGVIQRRLLPRPGAGVVYELTEYGRGLEDILLRLDLWGARSLREPYPEDIVTTCSMAMSLRAAFHPEAARDLRARYELRMGEVVVHAQIADGALEVGEGSLPEADLVIDTGPAIRPLLAGELSPAEAIESGEVQLTGDRELLSRFVEVFSIPSPCPRTMPA
jgi:DNA-binding HxlR family transcriptional regulator